ncbi:hypothetical protein [Bacillus sp. EB600]|nr:hypothetical protein [Bacillus sp. EB600]MCQ6281690.1 hypothetical protein [Bacillus sp. EB600]
MPLGGPIPLGMFDRHARTVVSLLCSPHYNEWAYDRVKGGRQANKIGKAK